MIFEYILSILHAMWNIIIFNILVEKTKKSLFNMQTFIFICLFSTIQMISINTDWNWYYHFKFVFIIWILYLYGRGINKHKQRIAVIGCCVETYIFTVLLGFILGVVCGSIYAVFFDAYDLNIEWFVVLVCMVLTIVLLRKYKKLQKVMEKRVWTIIALLGAFLLFFQQMLSVDFTEKNFYYIDVLLILAHFAMIFCVFMNLQHRHLTADNQRIIDDNQRMSQEIHRTRDVINVVSRVVAAEDTIDPKLRQELADFCEAERQEMYDAKLAATLIGDTGMDLLNALLRDKLCQCKEQNITFEAMIPGRIDTIVRGIGISEAQLLRIINDLVKNAVTAINKSENSIREILLILAVGPTDCLELCVYDSGVPFPEFILERFGERGNTTTGTGNGIADTVASLRVYEASIAIEPTGLEQDIYTKCVRICFDGKNEIRV